MRKFILVVLFGVLLGCSGGSKDQMIPLAEVPNNFLDTAKEKLPEVTFEQALKRGDGSWEIRGKDKKGKTRDVELSATGEVLDIE